MRMNPYPKWDQALLRGKYSVVCAHVEHNGLQIRPEYLDVEKHKDAIGMPCRPRSDSGPRYSLPFETGTAPCHIRAIIDSSP
jgi:hypothetical protein